MSVNEIVDIAANFTQNWLEDNISEKLYETMSHISETYASKDKFEKSVIEKFESYFETRMESFSEQLNKLKVTEEK
jgi:hypothetical protein